MSHARFTAAVIGALLAVAPASASDHEITGQLKLDKRLLLEQKGAPFLPIYHQAAIGFTAFPSDQLEVKVSSRLRYYDFALFEDIEGLGDPRQSFPMDLLLWESYVEVYNEAQFPEDHIDADDVEKKDSVIRTVWADLGIDNDEFNESGILRWDIERLVLQ